jgi:hypothetical protein
MQRRTARRLLAIAAVVAACLLATVHFPAADEPNRDAATFEEVASGDASAGDDAYFWETVRRVDGDAFVVGDRGERVRVTGSDRDVAPGAVVQVAGTVGDDGAVAADRVVVSDGDGRRYMFAVSGLAGLLALALVAARWRFDRDALLFRRRSG